MTEPVLGTAGAELFAACGPWADADDETTGFLLRWLCSAVTSTALDRVLDLSRDSAEGPGWSALLDLNRCPDDFLPWLAQFVGQSIQKGSTADDARNIILGRPSWSRGRPATIISAVKATLTGSKTVLLNERDTSAYHATVYTLSSQTPDASATRAAIAANKPGGLIIDLVVQSGPSYDQTKAALPASPTYADRKARFPTYGDIQSYTP